jgi:hypothetical protein
MGGDVGGLGMGMAGAFAGGLGEGPVIWPDFCGGGFGGGKSGGPDR